MPQLSRKLVRFIERNELVRGGDRVGIAVSGGADSVALLMLAREARAVLGVRLAVVHFNHKLRGNESDDDASFVSGLAQAAGLELIASEGCAAERARSRQMSVETAARALRYEFFRRLLEEDRLDRIATAHTLDDQAETVLMKMLRGTGTRGLAGIYPALAHGENKTIIRPMLDFRRCELVEYLKGAGQIWREDATNRDLRHLRNRIRHETLPYLEKLNPSLRETLAREAEAARGEEDYWSEVVAASAPNVWDPVGRALNAKGLLLLPLALQRRIVRHAAATLGLNLAFDHVKEILAVASGKLPGANLPNGARAVLRKGEVVFEESQTTPEPLDYEYPLAVPGTTALPEAGVVIDATLASVDLSGYNPEDLLQVGEGAQLTARNWRDGDRFWRFHGKAPRKIKELLARRRLTGAARKLWPVLAEQGSGEIVWMKGYGVRHAAAKAGKRAIVIRAIQMDTESEHHNG